MEVMVNLIYLFSPSFNAFSDMTILAQSDRKTLCSGEIRKAKGSLKVRRVFVCRTHAMQSIMRNAR